MQYVLLANDFGNLNTYMSSRKVGPTASVESVGVDVTAGCLQGRLADVKPTLSSGVWTGYDTYVPAASQTIVPWGIGALGMTGRYAVARFGGRLYRSHKGQGPFPTGVRGVQYTSDTGGGATPTLPTWDYLGINTPGNPAFSVASTTGAASLPAGSYTYYCTFYNALGQESPPATSSVSFTSAKDVTVTLPTAYAKCTFSSGANLIFATSATDGARLRVGMRITGTYIPANTYITAIASNNTDITISNQTTGTTGAGGVAIWDAQIVGTRVYRMGAGIDTPLLVQQTALGTASFTDQTANANLKEALTTASTADMPTALADIAISPTGVLLATTTENRVVYMSLVTPSIYDPSKAIKVAEPPLTTIYALNRFICPTIRGAFTVTIDDAILGLPVVQTIDDTEPCQVSYYVYASDVGGAVWWNTSKGIVQTDGNTIETVTRYTFARATATKFRDCYGADYYNNEYLAILEDETGASLYRFNQATGWTVITRGMSTTSPGALGFHIGDGCIIYTGNSADSPAAVRKLDSTSSRTASGYYKTGEWLGEKMSALKKFRKVSLLYTGSVSVQPYVDGAAVGGLLTGVNATMTRRSWWLPAGTKGRTMALKVTLLTADTSVQEMGVWVGEEREPMP